MSEVNFTPYTSAIILGTQTTNGSKTCKIECRGSGNYVSDHLLEVYWMQVGKV